MAFGYRSRISQGGVNLNEEATYYLAKFSWKLHENEENWAKRVGTSNMCLCRSATGIGAVVKSEAR